MLVKGAPGIHNIPELVLWEDGPINNKETEGLPTWPLSITLWSMAVTQNVCLVIWLMGHFNPSCWWPVTKQAQPLYWHNMISDAMARKCFFNAVLLSRESTSHWWPVMQILDVSYVTSLNNGWTNSWIASDESALRGVYTNVGGGSAVAGGKMDTAETLNVFTHAGWRPVVVGWEPPQHHEQIAPVPWCLKADRSLNWRIVAEPRVCGCKCSAQREPVNSHNTAVSPHRYCPCRFKSPFTTHVISL